MADFTEIIERQELIEKLRSLGDPYKELVDKFLTNENIVTTRKSRINKSSTCRVLGWKTKQLQDVLDACREILKDSIE